MKSLHTSYHSWVPWSAIMNSLILMMIQCIPCCMSCWVTWIEMPPACALRNEISYNTTITVKCLILYLYIFPAESIASSSLSASIRPPGSRPKQCESLGEQAPYGTTRDKNNWELMPVETNPSGALRHDYCT